MSKQGTNCERHQPWRNNTASSAAGESSLDHSRRAFLRSRIHRWFGLVELLRSRHHHWFGLVELLRSRLRRRARWFGLVGSGERRSNGGVPSAADQKGEGRESASEWVRTQLLRYHPSPAMDFFLQVPSGQTGSALRVVLLDRPYKGHQPL